MFTHIHAHEYKWGNRQALKQSVKCGCFGCRSIYKADEINEWAGDTAICAHCNIDGVLPDNAGYPLTEELMAKMHNYWLGYHEEFTPEELVEESNIEILNKYCLRMKGFRVESNDQLKPERYYLVYEGKEEFYFTKNPRELLIKVAQLLPDSDVKIDTEEISIGDEKVQQEKIIIRIHQQA